MYKKLQPYLFLLIFFTGIFLIFKYSTTFFDGQFGSREAYVSHNIDQDELLVKTTKGNYVLSFPRPETAEVLFFNDSIPRIDTSYAVLSIRQHPSISFDDNSEKLFFSTQQLEIVVNKNPFEIAFVKSGNRLLKQHQGFFDHDTLAGFRFDLGENEKIYGAGFRTTPLNRRGGRFELYNQPHYGYSLNAPNLNFSVPFVLSSNGYGLLFDNAQKGYLDIDSTMKNVMEFSSIGGKMAYYVVAGDNYDSIMNHYAGLTGYQPMPPRWVLGNIQSKFGYKNEKEAKEVVDKMEGADFSLDALVIDLYWFGEGVHDSFYMGNLEWYKRNWPSPEEMIRRFNRKNVKTVLITEPYVLEESKYFDTLSNAGMLGKRADGETYVIGNFWFGPGGLFDIFQPRMQDWFWRKYRAQIEKGITGWWGDLGEPETHPADMHHVNGMAEEVHNIYAHYWHKMLWDRYAAEYPDVRLFNLNRSGFAGSQRYSVYPWSGDVSRSWAGLQAQPTAVLGMTLSGFSYMHSDLGGFAGGEKDEELYVRWLQYGVFNPVFRVHGDPKAPVEPYHYSDSAQDILRDFINLRYRMLPYNYTLAWRNATLGEPLTRPLFFDKPGNPEIAGVANTYLWGPNILVAPVLEKGQAIRRFYAPEGTWYNLFDEEKITGGRWIAKEVTLQTIPAYARGGSFIPMIEPIPNTEEYSSDHLIIHYFIDDEIENASFTMYEDDGHTKDAVQKMKYELLHFKARNLDDLLLFDFNRDIKGKYDGMPEARTIELVVHGVDEQPENILNGNQFIPLTSNPESFAQSGLTLAGYFAHQHVLKIRFDWDKQQESLQIKF